jgi:hypothetical protein
MHVGSVSVKKRWRGWEARLSTGGQGLGTSVSLSLLLPLLALYALGCSIGLAHLLQPVPRPVGGVAAKTGGGNCPASHGQP